MRSSLRHLPRVAVPGLLGLALAACTTTSQTATRDPAYEARIAALEARLLQSQAAQAAPAERLNRIETQLAQIVQTLGTLAAAPAVTAAPAPAAPAASPAPAAPTAATEPLVQRAPGVAHEAFSPRLKRLGGALVEDYMEGTTARDERQRTDLLGKPLPQRRFLGPDGQIVDLDDFQGSRHVVLVILRGFAGQVCIGCSAQTVALAQSRAKFEQRQAQVLLLYPGDASSVPAFLDAVRDVQATAALPFPVLLDVNLGAVKTLMIEAELAKPTTVIVDRQGLVRYAYVGRDYKDRPSVPDLLAVLDKLDTP